MRKQKRDRNDIVSTDLPGDLSADRIVVGVTAFPLMESPEAVGALAFRFARRDGKSRTLIIPREECAVIRGFIDDLDAVDWRLPETAQVAATRPN